MIAVLPGLVPLGETVHVAATFDGTEMVLYVDGVPEAAEVFPYLGIYYGADDVFIGAVNLAGQFLRPSRTGGTPRPPVERPAAGPRFDTWL